MQQSLIEGSSLFWQSVRRLSFVYHFYILIRQGNRICNVWIGALDCAANTLTRVGVGLHGWFEILCDTFFVNVGELRFVFVVERNLTLENMVTESNNLGHLTNTEDFLQDSISPVVVNGCNLANKMSFLF